MPYQDSQIQKRYGAAIFKIAKESGKVDLIYDDMNSFLKFCRTQVCLKEFLAQSFIAKKERIKVISLIGKELSLSPEFINFISLLIENERSNYLFKIFIEYSRLKDEDSGAANVTVTSAAKMTEDEKAKVTAFIEKKFNIKPVINETVDETIFGGYIIKIGDLLYDGSIRTNINNLHNYLKQGAIVYGG